MDGFARELSLFASYICVTAGVPGLKEFLYLDFQAVHRLELQATGHFLENLVASISRTIQLIPQVLRNTFRYASVPAR